MLTRKCILFAGLGLILATIGWYGFLYWRYRPPKPNVAVAVFGSQENLNTFLSAKKTTAQRLHYRSNPRSNAWKLESYDYDASVAVSSETADTIQKILAREASYAWPITKMCAPDYGVLFTFGGDQATVWIALCFDCNILGVFDSTDDSEKSINREEDFDPAIRSLVPIVKSLFPDDAVVQALK